MNRRGLLRGLVIGIACAAVLSGGLIFTACQGAEEEGEASDNDTASEEAMVERRIEAISAELDLDEDQEQRLRKVRDLVHERRDAFREERHEAMESHLAELEAGELDSEAIHGEIDQKIDELRGTAHQVADELIALANSMDDEQRSRVAAKIRTFHERMESFHQRMESAGGHGAFFAHIRERVCSGHGEGFGPGMWFGDEEQSVTE